MAGFTIPNTPSAYNQNQAEPDSLDFQILGNHKNAVVSGMEVTPGSSGATVAVSAGEVIVNGVYYSFAGSASIALTAYSTTPFFDLVVARLSSGSISCVVLPGNAGTNPQYPAITADDVVLAAVWRPDNNNPLSSMVVDKRLFVRSADTRLASGTPASGTGSNGDLYVNSSWSADSTLASPISVKVGGTWYQLARYSSTFSSGTITANLTGNVTGNLTGNASSATLAAKASTLSQGGGNGSAMTFNWSGQSGQPTWLWGSNDGTNVYVYNPSNFSVNYATSAGSATSAGNADTTDGYHASSTWTAADTLAVRDGTQTISSFRIRADRFRNNNWNGYVTFEDQIGQDLMRISNAQSVYNLSVTGRAVIINSNGTLGTSSSTRRIKENIVNYDSSALLNVSPVIFDYKEGVLEENENRHNHFGLIAEDLVEVGLDHLVYKSPDGTVDGVAYEKVSVELLAVVKALDLRIKALEAQ